MIERSFRFEDDLYEVMKEIADAEGITVSQLLRMCVKRFVREYYESVDFMEVILDD